MSVWEPKGRYAPRTRTVTGAILAPHEIQRLVVSGKTGHQVLRRESETGFACLLTRAAKWRPLIPLSDPGFNLIELCQCLYSLIRPITFPLTLTSRPALTKIFAISRSFIFILNSESVREPVFTETTERLQRLVVQTRNATGRTPRSPVPTITIAQPRHFPSEGRASVSNNR